MKSKESAFLPAQAFALLRYIFEQLPPEIYHVILRQVDALYAHRGTVDVVGRQSDLKALLLVDRRWHREAREVSRVLFKYSIKVFNVALVNTLGMCILLWGSSLRMTRVRVRRYHGK